MKSGVDDDKLTMVRGAGHGRFDVSPLSGLNIPSPCGCTCTVGCMRLLHIVIIYHLRSVGFASHGHELGEGFHSERGIAFELRARIGGSHSVLG